MVIFKLRRYPKRKENRAMDLKLSGLEASAVMSALRLYLKDLEKSGNEKGILIEKKTVKDLVTRLEDMPSGEVP
jgi:hypothetical protein